MCTTILTQQPAVLKCALTKVNELTSWEVSECPESFNTFSSTNKNKCFEFKKLVGRRGALELELIAVLVLFTPIVHETLTNSNFDTNTICQLNHSSSFKCHKLKSISQQKCFADCFTDWHNIMNENVHVTLCLGHRHAGYYGVNPTLEGNPSDIRAFDCSCI